MLLLILQNAPAILCLMLALLCCIGVRNMSKNRAVNNVATGVVPQNAREFFVLPIKGLIYMGKKQVVSRQLLLLCVSIVFASVTLVCLHALALPAWATVLLFLPITILLVLMFYYLIWIISMMVCRVINIGLRKMNMVFSLVIVLILMLVLQLVVAQEMGTSMSGFYLMVVDLLFCFFLMVISLRDFMLESLKEKTKLTLRNVWKVAFLEIAVFLFILTMMAYTGFVYLPDAFITPSGNFSFFDAFYFIVVTFGTVGYGDIVPACVFTKAVSILTVLTNIACIAIMLSAVLTLSKKTHKKK